MRIKPEDIKKGMIFYESAYGENIRFESLDEPSSVDVVIREGELPQTQWHWQAKNCETEEIVDFTITSGMEHYGPKLYSEPAYCHPGD